MIPSLMASHLSNFDVLHGRWRRDLEDVAPLDGQLVDVGGQGEVLDLVDLVAVQLQLADVAHAWNGRANMRLKCKT